VATLDEAAELARTKDPIRVAGVGWGVVTRVQGRNVVVELRDTSRHGTDRRGVKMVVRPAAITQVTALGLLTGDPYR
jgi:hypothetical protein